MPETLALLDGNSLVHRAFHAIQGPLTSPSGELTNATYGFTMMLMRARDDLKPDYIAAAFDTPKPTFRHQQYAAYKATRPPLAEGLAHQLDRVLQVLEVLHIPVYRLDGVEADDLLGTLARQGAERGLQVVIITGDTDALQLVGPSVRVLAPRRGLTDAILYDEASVRARYGLDPGQLVDFKALVGDVSDNIPGVPGIGEKTAAKLLSEYGDIEGILANLDKLPSRQRDQIALHMEQMRMSRHLARILPDVPVDLALEDAVARPPDRDRTVALFHELGFRSLLDRLQKAADSARTAVTQPSLFEGRQGRQPGGDPLSSTSPPAPGPAWRTDARVEPTSIGSVGQLEPRVEALRSSGKTVALSLALSRPEPRLASIVGVAVAAEASEPFYVPFGGQAEDGARPLPLAEGLGALRPLLEDDRVPKVLVDAKQATVALASCGVELAGVELDAGIAAYLLEAGQRTPSLQDVAWSRLGREIPSLKSLTGEGRSAVSLEAVAIGPAATYFIAEAQLLGTLCPLLERELAEQGLESVYRDVDLPLVPVLADLERTGIAVDVPYLQELSRELYERITGLEAAIYGSVGHEFNISSPQQLSAILFDELGLPGAKRTSTGRQSTAADVLTSLRGGHPCIELILEHRELTKLKSTYVDALPLLADPTTGRVHTTFHQTVAATGRLSSSDPNLQNIPVRTDLGLRVRRAFIPEPGWKLLSADYSQIELRIEAHLAQDPTLLEAFRAGEDVHAATASELQGVPLSQVTREMRALAKTANFAIIYGVSAFGFAEQTGLSQREAAEFIRRYFDRFHEVEAFHKRLIAEARASGTVSTLLGRKRTIPELRSSVYAVRQAGERMAINAPVQGTASDIIKIAMVRLFRLLQEQRMRSRMLLQVHDELLFEAPEDELDELKRAAKRTMEDAMELSVPLVVDLKVADNWGAMY